MNFNDRLFLNTKNDFSILEPNLALEIIKPVYFYITGSYVAIAFFFPNLYEMIQVIQRLSEFLWTKMVPRSFQLFIMLANLYGTTHKIIKQKN